MDINLKLISSQDLSPDEYVYLYIVYREAYAILDDVKLLSLIHI